jgi:glucose/arabinose dehydrogenase
MPSHRRDHRSARRTGFTSGAFTAPLAAIWLSVSFAAFTATAVQADRAAPKVATVASNTTVPPSKQGVRLTKLTTAEQPLAAVQRPNDETVYLVAKTGRISALRGDTIDPYPVLDISARIDTTNERGLLGLAFSPNRRDVLYIDYTTKKGNVIVSELPFDGKVADPQRERVLLDVPKPFNEHNAGTLLFDGAGMLLVAIGDGGGSGDKFNNGQRTDTLLGKVLRIDPKPRGRLPYSIPPDNPFAVKAASPVPPKKRPEILAYGLRNPWQITLDSETNDLWIPDVGQTRVEEINRLPKTQWGANFGWSLREGNVAFKGAKPPGAIEPVYAYPHVDGRCAVVGGYVYRGTALPGLVGSYVFGDVCSGKVMALRATTGRWTPEDLGVRVPYLTAFGQLQSGELVATSLEGGVYRLDPAS